MIENKIPWMDGHMDEVLTLTQSWKKRLTLQKNKYQHGMMLNGYLSVSRQVKREAKSKLISKAHPS